MRGPGATTFIVCFGLLGAVVLPATPSAAFGLRLGPFHLALPFLGPHRFVRRHRVALRSDTREDLYDKVTVVGSESLRHAEPGLLYPGVALPGLFDEIFWPAHSPPWPFGYDAIFRSAFAKSPLDDDPRACQPGDHTEMIVARIRAEVRPRPAQLAQLEKLGQALGMAAGYLMKACPTAIPAQPVARLQLMQSHIQVLTMAIDLVRPPLQQFEQSLDAEQKARFAAMRSASSAAAECGTGPTATEWSVDDIDQSVGPGDSQRQALDDLEQSFASTAADLHAHCPNPLPPTPLARLEAIEARLDASWRAALSMQVALATFEGRLNQQQRDRFEAMNLAQAR